MKKAPGGTRWTGQGRRLIEQGIQEAEQNRDFRDMESMGW